jgi:hypothetical protein
MIEEMNLDNPASGQAAERDQLALLQQNLM